MSQDVILRVETGPVRRPRVAQFVNGSFDVPVHTSSAIRLLITAEPAVDRTTIKVSDANEVYDIRFDMLTPGTWHGLLFIDDSSGLGSYQVSVGEFVRTVAVRRETASERCTRAFAEIFAWIVTWSGGGSVSDLGARKVHFRRSGLFDQNWTLEDDGHLGIVIGRRLDPILLGGVRFEPGEVFDIESLDQPDLWNNRRRYFVKLVGLSLRERRLCREAVLAREDIWDLGAYLKESIQDTSQLRRALDYLAAGMRAEVRYRLREKRVKSLLDFLPAISLYAISIGATVTMLKTSPAVATATLQLVGDDLTPAYIIGGIGGAIAGFVGLALLGLLEAFWRPFSYAAVIGLLGISAYLLFRYQGRLVDIWQAVLVLISTVVLSGFLTVVLEPSIRHGLHSRIVEPLILEEVFAIRTLRAAHYARNYSLALGQNGSFSKNRTIVREAVDRIESAADACTVLFGYLANYSSSPSTRAALVERRDRIAATIRAHAGLVLQPGNDHLGVGTSLNAAFVAIISGHWDKIAIREAETITTQQRLKQLVPRVVLGAACVTAALYPPILAFFVPSSQVDSVRATLLVSAVFALVSPDPGKVRDAVIPALKK